MTPAPVIGIDLGTTFSGAAVYRNGKSEIIPNKEGHRLTPSFVFYDPRSLNVCVGTTADDMGVKCIENFLFDVKRIIGRKYDDVYIQKLITLPEYRFKIIRGENDMAEIELLHDNLLVQKSPETVSSEILKYLRESANEYLGVVVTEAVISIPAHFSNAQRKATRTAAELAGFKVLKLITEPVAAAIHYAEDRLKTDGTILVVDFGGGTLDVSVIEVDQKAFKVKSVEGDTFLGGRDFDQMLLQHFKDDMTQKFSSKIFTDRMMRRVQDACVRLKTKLSTQQDYVLTINCIGGDENKEYALELSRKEFEYLTECLCNKVMDLVEKCMYEAGMTKSDISEVVLVGGSTRIPKVRAMLFSYFGNKKLKTDLNPDEAVALGAAVQATILKEKFKDLEKYKITEVTPLSLGIRTIFDYMDVYITKNCAIPIKSPPIISVTCKNNQQIITLKIFEGERKICNYNNFLGSLTIKGLPPGKAGTVKINTVFSLNEDGILEVEAYETTSKEKHKVAVTIGQYRLCDYKLKNVIQDAEAHKREDQVFENFVNFAKAVYKNCNHVLYDLTKIPSETDREFVKKKCEEFKDYTEKLDFLKIDELQNKYNIFLKAIGGIVESYIYLNLENISKPRLSNIRFDPWFISEMDEMSLSFNSLSPSSVESHPKRTRKRFSKRTALSSSTQEFDLDRPKTSAISLTSEHSNHIRASQKPNELVRFNKKI